ncbi:hypothetical protein FOE78_04625 [Microlunatus elymi]|uniref:Uncharacterized protein n=1 Tax=Microlunatus elymi TaxID=2596828 RepID=A0A516PVS0_9ACTN|nr:hypothetical protein [Microlunatus elymi]QDP95288.1 hypothetical protein FOE78_04625 [Microlunatus elymi]
MAIALANNNAAMRIGITAIHSQNRLSLAAGLVDHSDHTESGVDARTFAGPVMERKRANH